jgi:hypothetical protein
MLNIEYDANIGESEIVLGDKKLDNPYQEYIAERRGEKGEEEDDGIFDIDDMENGCLVDEEEVKRVREEKEKEEKEEKEKEEKKIEKEENDKLGKDEIKQVEIDEEEESEKKKD